MPYLHQDGQSFRIYQINPIAVALLLLPSRILSPYRRHTSEFEMLAYAPSSEHLS